MNKAGIPNLDIVKIILILISGAQTGCIIPIQEMDMDSRNQVREGMLETFLIPGKINRTEVLLQFGEPDFISDDECFFAYSWEVTRALWLAMGPLGGMTGGVIPKQYLVMMEFDNEGALWRVEKTAFVVGSVQQTIDAWIKGG